MDTNILGLLMIGNWTIYEMRKMIETNFTSISSSSLGSMQTAIKKLLEMECITFSEHVENGVNKKVYSITTAGKRKFFSNISAPMKYKEKNMELNKFFFLGFLEKEAQITSLDSYIKELYQELAMLQKIQESVGDSTQFDEEYLVMLQQCGAEPEILNPDNGKTPLEMIEQIAQYQLATLHLGLAKIKFEISWFEEFIESLHKNKEVPQ